MIETITNEEIKLLSIAQLAPEIDAREIQVGWNLPAEEFAELNRIQIEVKGRHSNMLGRQRLDLEEGLEIGRLLKSAQRIVRKIRPKVRWDDYVQNNYGFKSDEYARRLKLLAEWSDEDPANHESIKDKGVTEAMRIAGIIHVQTLIEDSAEDENGDGGSSQASKGARGSRGKGNVEPDFNPASESPLIIEEEVAAKSKCVFSVNWQQEIMALLADEREFEKHARKGLCLLIDDKAITKKEVGDEN